MYPVAVEEGHVNGRRSPRGLPLEPQHIFPTCTGFVLKLAACLPFPGKMPLPV